MEGQWAELGKEYTLHPDSPMDFELTSAEFIATRILVGEDVFWPKADEKLLVLHFTIHNPQDSEASACWNTFTFTAVDAKNENREYSQYVGQEENSEALNMYLKPAQEIKAYTFIVVPAEGVIPKLIVQRSDSPVLRYDLKDKVKPLEKPYVDESDPTGATALGKIDAEAGTYYPTGMLDFKLDSWAYTDETYVDYTPEEGTHHLVLKVTIKNATPGKQNVYWSTFWPRVKAESGEAIEYNENILHGTRNDSLNVELEPGDEVHARFFFQVYTDDPAAKLLIHEGNEEDNNRVFIFKLAEEEASADEEVSADEETGTDEDTGSDEENNTGNESD